MALTLDDLTEQVVLAQGGTDDDRIRPIRIVNQAGRYLFGLHSWRFRERPNATIASVASQAYVAVPSDFGYGEITELSMSDSISFGAEQTDIGHLQWLRAQTISSPSLYFWALAYPTQTATTSAPGQPRIELFPTPTSTTADFIRLNYKAGWVELSAMESIANVPVWCEHLLERIVRAFTRDYLARTGEYIEEIMNSPELEMAKRMDGAAQVNLGTMVGGILQPERTVGYEWNFTTVNPS